MPDALIPSLALMTLGAFLAFAVIQLVAFTRKRSNSDALKRAFSDHSAGAPRDPDK